MRIARRSGWVGLAAGVVTGLVLGGVIVAEAQSSTVAMNAGDAAHVTCAGPNLSVANQTGTALDLTCAPNPTTTTTTIPPTTTTSTTTPGTGLVSEDQVAKALVTGTATAAISNSTPEVVVVFVSADDAAPGQTVGVSGGGLAWKLAGRTNTQRGDAEVWWAMTAGTPVSVTATPSQGGKPTQLTVITFAGSAGLGAVKGASAASGAPTVALTPQATGSWAGAVGTDWDNATNRTLGANQAMDAQNTDSMGDTYWVQHAIAHTTAGTAMTLNDSAPSSDRWDLEAVEVTPATGPPPTTTTTTASTTTTTTGAPGSSPRIDASTPAIVGVQNNVNTVASPTFAPPANTVLYAVFSMDSLPGSGALVSSVVNSGSPLSWHQTSLENQTNGSTVGGFVQVFWAANPTAQANVTVTATFNLPSKDRTPPIGGFEVLVMDNARADQSVAASQATSNVTSLSAPSATVTTTSPNSLVMGVFDNWDSSVTPAVPADQVLQSIVLNPVDLDTYWLQAKATATSTPGPVIMNATAPSNIHWHEIAWEILAA